VTPSSGSGSNQTFSFVFSDPNGGTDLWHEFILINEQLRGNGACLPHYDGVTLWLLNDTGSGWLGPMAPGSAATLENSQCVVSGTGSSVSVSDNNVTLNLALGLKPAFAGAKIIYMQAFDRSGVNTDMQPRGGWTVPQLTCAARFVSGSCPYEI
jgi:hypothetical protein